MKRFFANLIRKIFFWRKPVLTAGALPRCDSPTFRTTGNFKPIVDESTSNNEAAKTPDSSTTVSASTASEMGLRIGDKFETISELTKRIKNPEGIGDAFSQWYGGVEKCGFDQEVTLCIGSILRVIAIDDQNDATLVVFEHFEDQRTQYEAYYKGRYNDFEEVLAPINAIFSFSYEDLDRMDQVYSVNEAEAKEAERQRILNLLEAAGHR